MKSLPLSSVALLLSFFNASCPVLEPPIGQPVPLSVRASADDLTIAHGQPTILRASASGGTAPYTYAWSARNWTSADEEPTVTPSETTTYILTVTDSRGDAETRTP